MRIVDNQYVMEIKDAEIVEKEAPLSEGIIALVAEKMPDRKPPPKEIKQAQKTIALAMMLRGCSYVEISTKTGLSTSTVHALKVCARDGTVDQDMLSAAEVLSGTRAAKLALVADQAVDRISETLPEADTRDAATALREIHTAYRLESGQSTQNIALEGVISHALSTIGIAETVDATNGGATNGRLARLRERQERS